MKSFFGYAVVGVVVGTVLGGATLARAQSAQGQAFSAQLSIGGTSAFDQSDTGVGSAPNSSSTPNSFNKSASGAQIPANPLLEVITGPSHTRGCIVPGSPDCNALFTSGGSDPLSPTLQNRFFVHSTGGDAVASALVGQAPGPSNVLDAASSGSTADVVCDPTTGVPKASGTSKVDALVIAGTPVPIPGTVAPNTTILAPQLPLLVLNEQFCPDASAPAGTTRCKVNALHAELIQAGEVLDLKLSGATASLTNVSCPCPNPPCNPCQPNLNAQKTGQILQQDRQTPKNPQQPAAGDPIRFTVSVASSQVGDCSAESLTVPNLNVVDRIPLGVTVDTSSIQIQTDNDPPVAGSGTIANCDGSLSFPGCAPEAASDTGRRCLTVAAGSLAPTHTKKVSFVATVDTANAVCTASGNDRICNTAIVEGGNTPIGTPATLIITCPGTGDILRTFGGGGCSLGAEPNAKGSELLPVLFMGIFLALRQWWRRASRA